MVVEIDKLLSAERVAFLTSRTKQEALTEMIALISSAQEVIDSEHLARAINERESIMSTGIGLGIAVPHAKITSVNRIVMAVGVSREGIDFDSLDDEPVHIIVMIAAPEGAQECYIHVLAKVATVLKHAETRERILRSESVQEICDILARE